MEDPKTPPNPYLEAFLDKMQEKYPVTSSDEGRDALRFVYVETARAEHNQTCVEIFDYIKALLQGDLRTWATQPFDLHFEEMFRNDLRGSLIKLLSFGYGQILEAIGVVSGLQVDVARPALAPIPNHIEVVDADDLTEKEKAMLDRAQKGQA